MACRVSGKVPQLKGFALQLDLIGESWIAGLDATREATFGNPFV
jgi:hypothetical protein